MARKSRFRGVKKAKRQTDYCHLCTKAVKGSWTRHLKSGMHVRRTRETSLNR